jgi:hypothetical protein
MISEIKFVTENTESALNALNLTLGADPSKKKITPGICTSLPSNERARDKWTDPGLITVDPDTNEVNVRNIADSEWASLLHKMTRENCPVTINAYRG